MISLVGIIICFVTAARLQGSWSSFAAVCGVVQTISLLLLNSQSYYEARGGRLGVGDDVIAFLFASAGLLGSIACLLLLLASLAR